MKVSDIKDGYTICHTLPVNDIILALITGRVGTSYIIWGTRLNTDGNYGYVYGLC